MNKGSVYVSFETTEESIFYLASSKEHLYMHAYGMWHCSINECQLGSLCEQLVASVGVRKMAAKGNSN